MSLAVGIFRSSRRAIGPGVGKLGHPKYNER